MTEANASFGTSITIDGAAIAELTNIGGVDLTVDVIDVTSHDSSNAFREKIAGLIDAGQIPIEGNFYPGDTGQAALLAKLLARVVGVFVITFPSSVGATWTFNALVIGFKAADAPVDGVLPFSANLEITGKPELAVTASTGLTTPFFTVSGAGTVIVPAASGSVYDYVVNIATGVSSVTITPTATAGVITVNGNTVATGVASSAIAPGSAGSITEAVIVVQETGKTAKTYTLQLVRAAA